ncbi:PorP/SprF family type IX secretion system membrane protein [Aquimarina muelleri]|uniref:Membrane protein n=1 Tax=Aquimarina muelleri TaxID=279356 RepID=A0A918N289_9FLAO|nr:PorP/SprF family type IX secretion system membrane protein [Aquimarina muelleri]MCX2761855.1 PorP/SprF family type IX secretion system membrane protein [Aquimarina muelleri]GGX09884.1 membrane protein [Aquimarina muelleri]
MKKNSILCVFAILSSCLCSFIFAQQTPVFANYNYNTVILNPAHAGFYQDSDITITNRGYLNSVEGSPRNIGLTFNSPLRSKNMGLGAGVLSDQVGVTTTTTVFGAYAYKLVFDHNYSRARWWSYNPNVLSFGITAGVTFYNEDLLSLGIPNDPNFASNINTTVPTLGVGVLYNREHIYFGVSSPNVLGSSLSSEKNINIVNPIYAYSGYRFFATRFEEVLITPSILIKYVSGAPVQADFNTTINYRNKIEIGGGYRTNSSLNFLAGFHISNHFRVLYNYNHALRNTPVNNTHGVILSYRMGNGFSDKR